MLIDFKREILRGSASQYFCEACNKDFKDQEAKAAHFAEHIKCGFPGCMFEGHMLVIETHIKNAHGNGIGTGSHLQLFEF